jgi:hypothetical protein
MVRPCRDDEQSALLHIVNAPPKGVSAIVVLLGAQLNSEIEHQTATDSTVERDRPLGERGAVMADTVGKAA